MATTRLYRVTTRTACFGFEVDHRGVVVRCAPYGREAFLGEELEVALAEAYERGWVAEEVEDLGPVVPPLIG